MADLKNGIRIILNLPPVTKKNSQRILLNHTTGKPFVAPSKQFKEYERNCLWLIKRLAEPIAEPVTVKCTFYMPTARRTDLTNLLEAVDDILVEAGVLADDNYNIIASHDGSRVYIDRKNPRTEIEIRRFEE